MIDKKYFSNTAGNTKNMIQKVKKIMKKISFNSGNSLRFFLVNTKKSIENPDNSYLVNCYNAIYKAENTIL